MRVNESSWKLTALSPLCQKKRREKQIDYNPNRNGGLYAAIARHNKHGNNNNNNKEISQQQDKKREKVIGRHHHCSLERVNQVDRVDRSRRPKREKPADLAELVVCNTPRIFFFFYIFLMMIFGPLVFTTQPSATTPVNHLSPTHYVLSRYCPGREKEREFVLANARNPAQHTRSTVRVYIQVFFSPVSLEGSLCRVPLLFCFSLWR